MTICLDRHAHVTSLVQMPSPNQSVNAVILPNVRTRQPVHVRRNIVTSGGPNHEVPVVGHDAKCEQTYRELPGCRCQDLDKQRVIGLAVKDPLSAIRAIHDVQHHARFAHAPWPRHLTDVSGAAVIKNHAREMVPGTISPAGGAEMVPGTIWAADQGLGGASAGSFT